MLSRSAIIIFICILPSFTLGQFRVVKKPGDRAGGCPPPSPLSICDAQCTNDASCPEPGDKCCITACEGYACVPAVTEVVMRTKKGYCPEYPSGPWVCDNRCTTDGDCRRTHKCCRNRCGALACMQPQATFGGNA